MHKKQSTKQTKSTGGSRTGTKPTRTAEGLPQVGRRDRREEHAGSVRPKGRVELTYEEADRMVTQALDCELPEPEPFVKILVFLYDLNEQGRGPELSDSLHRLMTAAYNNSNVHSADFDEYLEAIRRQMDG
ncbi:MAG: hypothetical protein ACREDR_28265 [Blastocatellia bacterium]